MSSFRQSCRSLSCSAAACLLAAGLLAGCDKRALNWSYSPGGPEMVQPGRSLALVQEYGWQRGLHQQLGEVVSCLAGELMARGYRVVVLHEPLPSPMGQATSGPATSPSGQPAAPAPPRLLATHDILARYAAAQEVQADLLVELHARMLEEVNTTSYGYGGPFFRVRYYTTVSTSIQQATLRLSNPRDRTLVGTVTVRYDDTCDEPSTVAADLGMGLDFIRKGVPPQAVTLKGSPGSVKVIREPTPPAGGPARDAEGD